MRSNSVLISLVSPSCAPTTLSGALATSGRVAPSLRTSRLTIGGMMRDVCQKRVLPSVLVVLLSVGVGLTPTVVSAAEVEVTQQNKRFSVRRLRLKVGDTVNFVNRDRFSHNIYSLSRVKSFDLGTFAKGNSRKVTFDKPGKIEVECAIHSRMRMIIQVSR